MRIQVYVIAFIFILKAGRKVDAQSLPRPSNVSIICDSYKVEVHWQYPHAIKDVVFQVEVKGNKWKESQSTGDHWMNISNMIKNPVHNHYVVYVTAKQGVNMSEKSKSDIFSFNEYIMSTIKCQLDFPEVTLSAKEGQLHLQFKNPLHLYNDTPALRNNTDILTYTAGTDKDKVHKECEMKLTTCETLINFTEERKEYCLNLTGKIGQRVLKDKRQCFSGDLTYYPPPSTYLYPLLGVISTLMAIAGILMLLAKRCNEKIKQKAVTSFPPFLDFKPAQTHLCKPLKMEPENIESNVQIIPVICDEDPAEHVTLIEISDSETSDGSEHYSKNAGDLEVTDVSSSNVDAGNFVTDFNYNSSSFGLSSSSGDYDCPHVHMLEMSPGDLVEGYRA